MPAFLYNGKKLTRIFREKRDGGMEEGQRGEGEREGERVRASEQEQEREQESTGVCEKLQPISCFSFDLLKNHAQHLSFWLIQSCLFLWSELCHLFLSCHFISLSA